MSLILSINSGSSSVKAALFSTAVDARLSVVLRARIESIGDSPRACVRDASGRVLWQRQWQDDDGQRDHASVLEALVHWLDGHMGERVRAAGHRIVHGGASFTGPRAVDAGLMSALEALSPLAPLHQQQGLEGIRALARMRPGLMQVASFDTAFHHTMPEVATRLGLPRALHERGIRRYGFHGLSYEYIAGRLAEVAPPLAAGRCVVAHLGSGASLCALKAGRSIDTTMGFSVLDGLVMSTRCGSLDPGVVLHLQTALGMDRGEVEEMLYRRSGLLGISGLSSDLRELRASDAAPARQAIETFIWRAARECAALVGCLRGIDGLVFTGGIGENDAWVRARLCNLLGWLGLELDEDANTAGGPLISGRGSAVSAWVLPTDEEMMIARHTLDVVQGHA